MKLYIIFAALFFGVANCVLPKSEVSRAKHVDIAKDETKHEKVKEVNNINYVYLEDVIYGLKNQNWTGDVPCLNKTLVLLEGLQNFSLWAVWNWDSVSSQPLGLLYGNQYQLGNFDECMNPPWLHSHPELKTQYCIVDITLERTDNVYWKKTEPFDPYQSALDFIQNRPLHKRPLNQLTWGICIPATCKPDSVEKLLHIMIARSHIGTAGLRPSFSDNKQCQKAGVALEYDGLFYGFFALIIGLILVAIICTIYRQREIKNGNISSNRFIKAFCLINNSSDLLKMKKEGSEVLYGVRFLAMFFIVMGHQIGFFNSGAVSDGAKVDQDISSTAASFYLHCDLFVDTFFVLSGFLLASGLMETTRTINPLLYILKRYIRIVVSFAIVMFFIAAVFPHTGSGPLWPRVIESESGACRRNWWLGMIMMGNYINTRDMCLVISWYIPADFHFFVIAVCMFWIYQHCKKIGVLILVALSIASLVTPAIVNFIYDLPALQLFTYEFVVQPRFHEQFHMMYIKSHTRFAAYLIGFLTGCIFARLKKREFKISTKWATIGASASVFVMFITLATGPLFLWHTDRVEAALYAALNRPLWAAATATMTLCCCFGYVPWLSSFLTWYPFVPLSRLVYGLYLTHSLFITRNVFSTRNPAANDYFVLFIQTLGLVVIGLVAAYFLWLVAEAPSNKILTIIMLPRRKQKPSEEMNVEIASSSQNISSITGPSTSGHLKENLPTTLQYSSKF